MNQQMKMPWRVGVMLSLLVGLTVACGDDDNSESSQSSSQTTTTASSTSSSGVGGSGVGGSGGAGVGGAGVGGAGGADAFLCSSAREQALGPIAEVSDGVVTTLSEQDGKELFVDASAGGFQAASTNPYIYLDLATATRVDIDDVASFDAATWDVALKRVSIRNNSAHSGGGDGASAFLAGASFATVSLSDAQSATLLQEEWFDDMCEYAQDPTGALLTSMSDWYDYDGATMSVTPKDGVYVIRGADGSSFFKLQILDYYSNPDGTPGMSSGRYRLRVATL